jgi:transcriptional regulator GlxA family with amidase domain
MLPWACAGLIGLTDRVDALGGDHRSSESGDRLAEVIAWARANLDRQLTLDELAARTLMSRRSFVRHFKAATGATPHAWLFSQRLSLAEELLEATGLPIEQIADRVGYRGATVFREQFTARRSLVPRDYRQPLAREHARYWCRS